jgi:hypothetical protein
MGFKEVTGMIYRYKKTGKLYRVLTPNFMHKENGVWREDLVLYEALYENGDKHFFSRTKEDFESNFEFVPNPEQDHPTLAVHEFTLPDGSTEIGVTVFSESQDTALLKLTTSLADYLPQSQKLLENRRKAGKEKLSFEQVQEIRRLREEEAVPYYKLAAQFGVTKSYIMDLCNYKFRLYE